MHSSKKRINAGIIFELGSLGVKKIAQKSNILLRKIIKKIHWVFPCSLSSFIFPGFDKFHTSHILNISSWKIGTFKFWNFFRTRVPLPAEHPSPPICFARIAGKKIKKLQQFEWNKTKFDLERSVIFDEKNWSRKKSTFRQGSGLVPWHSCASHGWGSQRYTTQCQSVRSKPRRDEAQASFFLFPIWKQSHFIGE